MKLLKGSTTAWALTITVLLTLNLVLRGWIWTQKEDLRGVARRMKVVHVLTNDTSGIAIVEEANGQPVWAEWDFAGTGDPDTFSFFFQGRNVMNVYLPTKDPAAPPRIDVSRYDDEGNLKVVWADRSGQGMFTERTFYNSGEPRMELWYKNGWASVEQKNGRGGVVIDGVWREVRFTNGVWTIVAEPQ